MIHYFGIVQEVLYSILIVLHLLLTNFWLICIIRNARKTWREFKQYKISTHIDYQVRAKILFNYKTVLIKDAFLICITVIEIIIPFYVGVPAGSLRLYEKSHTKIIHSIEKQYKCEFKLILDLLLIDPAVQLIPISYGVLSISSMMSMTILSTYLARRYFGYSLEKSLLCRLIVWWVIQIFLLFTSLIPYLQLLICTLPVLQTIDWIILLKSSRKLSRTLKSKLFETLHFEYNYPRYRRQRNNYIIYNVFITVHLLSVLSTILLVSLMLLTVLAKGIVLNHCYLQHTYNIDLEFNLDNATRAAFSEAVRVYLERYASLCIDVVYGLLLVLPYLCISLAYVSHFMCRGVTSIRAYRFNYAMIQPLLAQDLR